MKIALVTKGDKQFGTGHIVRCSRIFDALLARKLNPILYVDMPIEYSSLVKSTYPVNKISQFNAHNIRNTLDNNYFDIIIYDALTPDMEIIKELELHCDRLMFLDWQYTESEQNDLIKPSIIINGITGDLWPINEFHKHKNVQHYQGARYAILNPNINSISKSKKSNTTNSILVFMGGSDPNNWTQRIIDNCQLIFASALKKQVEIQFIIGKYINSEELISLVNKTNTDLQTDLVSITQSPHDFLERLGNSDAIITCGGITMFEAVAMGVYPIALPQVGVQLPACTQFANRGIASLVTENLVFDVDRLTIAVENYVNIQINDKNLKQKLTSALDSKGLERVIDIIESKSRF